MSTKATRREKAITKERPKTLMLLEGFSQSGEC
jgi:hypothetical protein